MKPTSFINRLPYSTIQLEVWSQAQLPKIGGGAVQLPLPISTGTGVLFKFSDIKGHPMTVLLTNKHVVEGGQAAVIVFHLSDNDPVNPQPIGLGCYALTNLQILYIHKHPDPTVDLCAIRFDNVEEMLELDNQRAFTVPFTESCIPTQEELDAFSAVEDVLMVGYPSGLVEKKRNFPLIRRGITAVHPAVDFFVGEPPKASGVIDIAAFPGSSGSPIVQIDSIDQLRTQSNSHALDVPGAKLLGLLWGGPTSLNMPTSLLMKTGNGKPMHIGFYVKSSEILSLRDSIQSDPKVQAPAHVRKAQAAAGKIAETEKDQNS